MKEKERADWGQEMLVIIRCRIFCLRACYTRIQISRSVEL